MLVSGSGQGDLYKGLTDLFSHSSCCSLQPSISTDLIHCAVIVCSQACDTGRIGTLAQESNCLDLNPSSATN